MLSRRVQYVAYFFFGLGTGLYLYSFFSDAWYKIDYSEALENSFIDSQYRYYTEGLISVCWFGDCVSLGAMLPHKTLHVAFVARVLMILAIWILIVCFCVTVYKLHFTPDWWKSKALLGVLGCFEVCAGGLMCISTFYYLYYHDLSRSVGSFQYGCYSAWLAGAMFITYGLFAFVSVSSVILPVHPASKYSMHTRTQTKKEENTGTSTVAKEVFSTFLSFPRLSKIVFSSDSK